MELTAANELDVVDTYGKALRVRLKEHIDGVIKNALFSVKRLKEEMKWEKDTFKNVSYEVYTINDGNDLEIRCRVKVDTQNTDAENLFKKIAKKSKVLYGDADYDSDVTPYKKTKTGFIFDIYLGMS